MGWLVKATVWPHYRQEREPVPIEQKAGWYQGPVWMGAENVAQPVASGYTNYAISLLHIYHD